MKVRYLKITVRMAMAALTAIGLIFLGIGSTAQAAGAATTQTVLVVYSQQAASASANVYTEMTTAEAVTNQAYTNSMVDLEISIVKVLTSTYSDTGDMNWDLTQLTGTADGYLDYIHDLRNQYNADMVVLIVENGGDYCSLSWQHDPPAAGNESTAFAVVARSCATANLSFPHALGHLQGLREDCAVDCTGSTDVHGYVDIPNLFRTIMAYNTSCAPSTCTRIPYFSNPAVNYLGNPTGVDDGGCDADAETSLENGAGTVAAWRALTDGDGDGVPDTEDTSPANAAVATPPSSTGAGQVTIQTSSGTLAGVNPIQDTDPSVGQAGKPAGNPFRYGLFKFNVTGMGAGSEATVTLTFPSALPAGTKYYKATAGGGFVEYPHAVIAGNTITLTLKDGDPAMGDSDGAADNTITDPGGPATCVTDTDLDGTPDCNDNLNSDGSYYVIPQSNGKASVIFL